jgi:rhodanese-related sulfurtransferase/DNA-binding HxlR family transcriptional regulator
VVTEFDEQPIYAQLARIGKAVANPVRLRLLDVLDSGERPVDELADDAGISLKNTSAQLRELRPAGLVSTRKAGTRIYYSVADEDVSRFLLGLQDFAYGRLADPATLVIDVRTANEYALGHVPGAISVPMAELYDQIASLPQDMEIVAYCGGPYCVVSPRAVRLLRENGRRARPLDGGLSRWRREGRRMHARPQTGAGTTMVSTS